jgi:hypothetical protein
MFLMILFESMVIVLIDPVIIDSSFVEIRSEISVFCKTSVDWNTLKRGFFKVLKKELMNVA